MGTCTGIPLERKRAYERASNKYFIVTRTVQRSESQQRRTILLGDRHRQKTPYALHTRASTTTCLSSWTEQDVSILAQARKNKNDQRFFWDMMVHGNIFTFTIMTKWKPYKVWALFASLLRTTILLLEFGVRQVWAHLISPGFCTEVTN